MPSVLDDGHEFRGTDEIRNWLATAASEFAFTRTLISAEAIGAATWLVVNHLEGDSRAAWWICGTGSRSRVPEALRLAHEAGSKPVLGLAVPEETRNSVTSSRSSSSLRRLGRAGGSVSELCLVRATTRAAIQVGDDYAL
jgi:hypothetical protein